MTKEELEKEAEEKYGEVDREFIACQDEGEVFNIGYVLGAEPREKRIEELEESLGKLQKSTFNMIDKKNNRIAELEAQINEVKHYLDYDIPHDLINEATTKIWRMLK